MLNTIILLAATSFGQYAQTYTYDKVVQTQTVAPLIVGVPVSSLAPSYYFEAEPTAPTQEEEVQDERVDEKVGSSESGEAEQLTISDLLDDSPVVSSNANGVVGIFKSNCAGCHGSKNPKSGLNLVDPNSVAKLSREDRINILNAVEKRKLGAIAGDVQQMPPGKSLRDEELAEIRNWVLSSK